MMTRRIGFSMIELLVVMSIVAVLAGLLLPVVGLVRGQAQTVACLGNLRQVGMALASYAQDTEGLAPWQFYYGSGAAPCSLDRIGFGSPRPANALGFLLLGRDDLGPGVDSISATSRPRVLRCPSRASASFFDTDGHWCSYLYQSPAQDASGATSATQPNLFIRANPGWATVIDQAQNMAGRPEPHRGRRTAVLYFDIHAESRPWIASVPAWGIWTRRFDSAGSPSR